MPVTLKSAHVKYKDSDGHYVGINSVSDNTTAEQVAQIQSAGTTQINAVAAKGVQTLASIPQDYTTLSGDVDDNDYLINAKVDRVIDGVLKENDMSVALIDTAVTGLYIASSPSGYFHSAGSGLVVYYVPALKGYKYNIKYTSHSGLSDAYGAIAFSTEIPAANVNCDILKFASTTATDIDFDYYPAKNGYLTITKSSTNGGTRSFAEIAVSYSLNDEISGTLSDAEETQNIVNKISKTILGNPITYSSVSSLYMKATGVFASAGSGLVVYYIPVVSGKRYNLKYSDHTMLAEYCSVGFSESVPASGGTLTVLKLATTTATNIDFTYSPNTNGYLCVSKSSSGSGSPVFCEMYYAVNDNPSGKTLKIQLFGDSITDNTWGDNVTWANHITSLLPDWNVTVVNSAVGGSFLKSHNSTGVEDLVTDGTTLETDANIVVIFAGTNDWASGSTYIGSITNATAGFYKAVRHIIEYINAHSTATVLVITPIQRYNSADQERPTNEYGEPLSGNGADQHTLEECCEAIKIMANFLGTDVLDMYHISGFNRINIMSYTTDGLHPNNLGDKKLAAIICAEINRIAS